VISSCHFLPYHNNIPYSGGTSLEVRYMANYTEISRDVALDILELYNIKGVRDLIPLSFGISNTNYRVNLDSGDAVILKISNDKVVSSWPEEQKILQYLKQNGFPYSLSAYLTNEGQSVYEYGEYCGVVFHSSMEKYLP
jgi:Ser/Thr protein kinase RdoA (MazF antagonist)